MGRRSVNRSGGIAPRQSEEPRRARTPQGVTGPAVPLACEGAQEETEME